MGGCFEGEEGTFLGGMRGGFPSWLVWAPCQKYSPSEAVGLDDTLLLELAPCVLPPCEQPLDPPPSHLAQLGEILECSYNWVGRAVK